MIHRTPFWNETAQKRPRAMITMAKLLCCKGFGDESACKPDSVAGT